MAEQSPSPQALERKLATILSADVAEYSRLMAEDEEQTLRTFRGHAEIFQSLVALHRGRIFNTAGDAMLAEFGSAVEAVRCATEIQATLRTRNDQLPASRQVRFRVGVNLGDVMVQGQDLLGDGVNVAARLQSAAEPGGICISGSVYDQIRNKLSLSFKSLGERSFKNIPQTVRTFSITEAEGHGALPASENERRALAGNWAKWLIAAVLLFVVAGGYWAFSQNHRAKLEQARALAETKRQMAEGEAKAAAGQRAAERAEPVPKRTEPGAQAVAVPAEPPRPPANAPSASGATPDGLYAGPICYGPAAADPPRCFRAQATISRGRIAGQWPGRDPGVTMFLVGEVSASGEAKIHMHAEKPDGTRISAIDLAGTLKDGRLDATGSFRNGRTATLNWRKSATGSR
jgi:class 3 adenylate cyclase/cbb3-type cytochrome oxidase subunit 3